MLWQNVPIICSYLRCSPEVLAHQREENSAFHQVSTVLKYLIPKKAPKVAMFGPGLESSTSGIVRKMLYEDQSHFTRVAMFPGQFDGKWMHSAVIVSGHSLLLFIHNFSQAKSLSLYGVTPENKVCYATICATCPLLLFCLQLVTNLLLVFGIFDIVCDGFMWEMLDTSYSSTQMGYFHLWAGSATLQLPKDYTLNACVMFLQDMEGV